MAGGLTLCLAMPASETVYGGSGERQGLGR